MDISQAGIDFIKSNEGLELESYPDSGGVWTVGYGTTKINGYPVQPKLQITKQQAEEYLKSDLKKFVNDLNELIKVQLNQNQFDSLCSFIYNIGATRFSKSTLLKKLNQNDLFGASQEFMRWIFIKGKPSNGLIKRRQREKELFLKNEN